MTDLMIVTNVLWDHHLETNLDMMMDFSWLLNRLY